MMELREELGGLSNRAVPFAWSHSPYRFLLSFLLALFLSFLPNSSSYAVIGDGGAGWVQVPYLIKILTENVRRYQQLKQLMEVEQNRNQYLRLINEGLENSLGLLNSLPIEDEKILSELNEFNKAYKSIVKIYGQVPKGPDATMQILHDQTVAESIKMVGNISSYTQMQEANARSISIQSRRASPKGAARMTAESNAKILSTLNQILKINGQILKIQSEHMAFANKKGKESVGNFNRINAEMKRGMRSFKGDLSLPRF